MKVSKVAFVILIVSLFIFTGCGEDVPEPTANVPDYSIHTVEDLHIGSAVRYNYNAIVDQPVDEEGLQLITKDIIEKAKKENKFNAVSVMFYDYPQYVGRGYTLGRADFAPEGDWAKAADVSTGDYNAMDYSWNFRLKNWDARLSEDEVEIWNTWYQTYDLQAEEELDDPFETPDEDAISQEVANQFSLTPEEVNDVLTKQMTWTFMEE